MTTSVFKPVADARLSSSSPSSNFGLAPTTTHSPGVNVTLEKWDLSLPESGSQAIPAGATINSVSFTRTATSAGSAGDYEIQRVTRTWAEGTGGSGGLTPPDGASWDNFDPTIDDDATIRSGEPGDPLLGEWVAAGGDTTGKTWSFSVTTGTGTKTITGSFADLVQASLDSYSGIVNIRIARTNAGTTQTWGTINNATPANHPTMTVDWTAAPSGPTAAQKSAASGVRGRGRGRTKARAAA